MYIDCIGITRAIEYGESKNVEFIASDIANFPFMIKNSSSALIIGSGGGIDVVRADLSGIKNITAVEINPITIKFTEKLISPAENIYHKDNVKLIISEARSFIENSNTDYDLIYIPSSKKYGGSGIVSYALLENYLYTENAFETYINHLSANGMLAIVDIKWFIQNYVETGILALANLGIDNPAKHIFLLEGKFFSVVIFQKHEFSEADKENLILSSSSLGFAPKFLNNAQISYYLENSVPVTDNHPYFWNSYTLESIIKPDKIKYKEYLTFKNEQFLKLEHLFILFFSILAIYLAAIFIPPAVRKIKLRNVPNLIIYFSGIGIGFITLELALIQKFTLFLEHPIFSISLVLSSILFFGGFGSFFTKNISAKNLTRAIRIFTLMLVVFLLLFIASYNYIFEAFSGFSIIIRGLIAITLLSLPSFFLGVFMPLGLKITEQVSKDLIQWMWSIDAIATVMGGVMSTIIALFFGFKAAMISGLFFYVFSLISISRIKK